MEFQELLAASSRPILMGILNVTPDSFSDGGDYSNSEKAIEHGLEMIRDGAEIVDIGAESTRPAGQTYGEGAKPITSEEEIARLRPVIEGIRKRDGTVFISVDTTKADVAEKCLKWGANIINDVSSGTADAKIFDIAAINSAPIILMHGHGPRFAKARIEDYSYGNVLGEVRAYLRERIAAARKAGAETVLGDVGIGFAKTYGDNLKLIKSHSAFLDLGVPMVLGVSRKAVIGRAMGGNYQPKARLIGSVAAALYGVKHGAKILRVHDVRATREALSVMEAIEKA